MLMQQRYLLAGLTALLHLAGSLVLTVSSASGLRIARTQC
jgi:hypothetical protein